MTSQETGVVACRCRNVGWMETPIDGSDGATAITPSKAEIPWPRTRDAGVPALSNRGNDSRWPVFGRPDR
jgi:hypothetical protein